MGPVCFREHAFLLMLAGKALLFLWILEVVVKGRAFLTVA